MIKPVGWFLLISAVGFFVFPPVSILVIIPLILWFMELFGLKRAVDPFFPKADSQTIYAKIHSVNTPKKLWSLLVIMIVRISFHLQQNIVKEL